MLMMLGIYIDIEIILSENFECNFLKFWKFVSKILFIVSGRFT